MAVSVKIELEGFSANSDVRVRKLTGTEEMSVCYRYDVTIELPTSTLGEFDPLGKGAKLIFSKPGDAEYAINAKVAEMEQITDPELPADMARFRMFVTHAIWFMGLAKRTKIYIDTPLTDVLADQLDYAGVTHDIDSLPSQLCAERPLTTQYKETALNFVSRLMEDRGVYYYFKHTNEDAITISDSVSRYDSDIEIKKGEIEPGSWSRKARTAPTVVKLTAYDFMQPSHIIQGEASVSDSAGHVLEINSNDEFVRDESEANLLAQVRLEQMRISSDVVTFRSFNYRLSPGSTFSYSGESYLVIKLASSYVHEDTQKSGEPNHYRNNILAIKADTLYRPELITRRPFADGVEIAHIHSNTDSEVAMIDEDGLYTVTLNYVSDDADPPVSKIRMMQPAAGQYDGFYFPLKDQVEVVIAFTKGNPDLPYIHGAMSNGQFPSHVKGGENAHQSIIKARHTLLVESRGGKHTTYRSKDFYDNEGNYDSQAVSSYGVDAGFLKLNDDGSQSGSMDHTEEHSGNNHISRRYGHEYSYVVGNSFNWGANPTYNFGTSYSENHVDTDAADNTFDMSSKTGSIGISGADDKHLPALTSKTWGDVCQYQNGRVVTWGEYNGSALEEYSFGSRYTSKQVSIGGSPVQGGFKGSDGFVEDIQGDTYTYQQGDAQTRMMGDTTAERTGDVQETITGDDTVTRTGDVQETHTGDVTSTLTGDTTSTVMGDVTSTHMGNTTAMITGDSTAMITGNITETHSGTSTKQHLGSVLEDFIGLQQQNTIAGFMKTNLSAGIEIGGPSETKSNKMKIEEGKMYMRKYDLEMASANMAMYSFKMLIIG